MVQNPYDNNYTHVSRVYFWMVAGAISFFLERAIILHIHYVLHVSKAELFVYSAAQISLCCSYFAGLISDKANYRYKLLGKAAYLISMPFYIENIISFFDLSHAIGYLGIGSGSSAIVGLNVIIFDLNAIISFIYVFILSLLYRYPYRCWSQPVMFFIYAYALFY